MSKQNFTAFRSLLRGAICNRTQAQFANESGISVEHLNRMLNSDVIYRPSRSTLHKIAAVAKNGITYQILKDALDKDDPSSVSPENQDEQANKAAFDFRPEFPDAAKLAMKALCEEINGQPYPVIANSLAEHMDRLVAAVADRNTSLPKISYDLGIVRPYHGKNYECAAKYVRIDLSMADKYTTAASDMLLYFTEIPCQGGEIKYVIQNASCAVSDIMELFGMPPAALAAYMDKDSDDNGNKEDSALEQAMKDPFYVDIQESEQFREDYNGNPSDSPEQRLLDTLFGKETHCPAAIEGIGFCLRETPPNLLDFLLAHREAVLSPYLSEPKNYDNLSSAMDELSQTRELQPFLDKLDAENYTDNDMNNDMGWPAAIALIMSEETGFPFVYKKKSNDPSNKFPWLSQYSVIILPDEAAAKNGIQREAILLATCQYVRELGLKRFGDLLFRYIQTLFRKPHSYVVAETSENNHEQENNENNPELTDDNYSVCFKNAPYPEKSGIYAAKLKDGRKIKIVYLSEVKAWVKLHKEWSDLIESYCPEPLHTESTAK